MKISRRSLAKGLAATGAAAGLSALITTDAAAITSQESPSWKPLYPGIWKATIGTPERFTPVSTRMIPPLSEAFAKLPAVHTPPLAGIRGKKSAHGCMVELPLRANEEIFGLGLQFLSFAQRGKKKKTRVNADPRIDTGDSNAPVPFYVTTAGIGILIDTARYATFYFGDARPRPSQPIETVSSASTDPNYTHNITDADEGQITVEVPDSTGIDIYLFAGPQMLDVVRRYNVFSGGGHLPPEWGLGVWYRVESRATHESALTLAREFRDRSIPCDVIGLEAGWQSHAYSCTFAWNQDRFPAPAAFVRYADELNYKINLWEHAFTHPASPLFPALSEHACDFGVWGGLVPDFGAEPARSAFGAYHARTFLDIGISGFKLDECDNSDYTGGWSFPECSTFPSGVDGEQMHSLFGLQYQLAIWNEFKKRKQPTWNLVRSSGALAAPYPFVLYSDLYGHRDFIRALVNSGFSGLLWCPEVRDAVNEEDLIRRLQSAVFSPLAMVNGWYIKNPPWKQLNRRFNNADQLLDNWEKLEARCREILEWRMQLVPYLRAAFHKYADDGTPPFRALVMDAPSEKRLFAIDDQYMVGDRMMVAPLFAGEPSRKVVLPEGRWHNFWTGEPLNGPSEITVPASTEKIPVYVKSGSVIPWADVGLFAASSQSRRITGRVYGDGSRPFSFDSEKETLRLFWSNGRGSSDGTRSYQVYDWQELG